ncbi:formate/nitrite transporter family protein [Flavobacterium sp. ASW18X]|uniref:formate/nitrite transporter family protein n=1 Tax=Flavobacterium sp. ASW18X TaxID=2572595 RepID=UPI0010AEE10E|nr:formate/nitrite transporter family protein [Flavobacterium sp. ASW18X]TKD66081.1 formate/nitrite transporter family protein [Flavobacterium sp. ASW18X]
MAEKEELDKKIEEVHENANQEQVKTEEAILVDQLCEGLETYKNKKTNVFISALIAGLEIGFSFLLLAILHHLLKGKVSKDLLFPLLAFAYPVGFIIVVLGKSILFTEQTSLLTLPVLHKRRSVKELLQLWGIVILGNLLGGYIFAFLGGHIGLSLEIITIESIEEIAHHVSKSGPLLTLGSAIFAGWLMAVLSWLLSSSRDTISRIVIIYLITFTVGFAGFHHSIVGNIEVFAGLIFTHKVSISDYLGFQGLALLGNAIGGVVFVAGLRYRAFASNF